MKKLITLICLMATLAGAESLEMYYSVTLWNAKYDKIADMLRELYEGQQSYPLQVTNVFYALFTNEIPYKVETNVWKQEWRSMTVQEERDLCMTGWTPIYIVEAGVTNLTGYTGKREEFETTSGKILHRATKEKIKSWKLIQGVNNPNVIFKKDGIVIEDD